ncbi:MAG: hypothetical protein AMXMBFR64_38740 [Myxococcales bacterium]
MLGFGREERLPTYIGSVVGLISFLMVGLVPGVMYGGHMGLVMVEALLGMHAEPSLFTKVVTGGGILLGLVTTLFFFLVVGALVGTFAGLLLRPFLRAGNHPHKPGA